MTDKNTTSRRVVITAVGLFSSLGTTAEEVVGNLKKGHTTFTRLSFDRTAVAAPIEDFDLRRYSGPFKDRRYLNRGAQFSVAAALAARNESGLDEETAARAGLFVGSGPNLDMSSEFAGAGEGMNREELLALWILRFLPNTAASAIARLAGLHGENLTVATACTASLQAIGEAFRKIRDGYLELAFAGGGDSRIHPGGVLAYKKAGAIFVGDGEAACASRPFDEARLGFVPGEGGAFFLLEEEEHARRRGARIYGEVCGFGASLDGYSMTAPDPAGLWQAKAVRAALREAGMPAGQIDVVASHGTGTVLNDAMEAQLLARIFGRNSPPVIALKSWIGHLSVACGAVELALCLFMMRHSYLPEIRNLHDPSYDGLNYVRRGTTRPTATVLVENFGFGGQNSALIVRGVSDRPEKEGKGK